MIRHHTGALHNNILSNDSSYAYYFISPLIGTCVPIFFFVSGYLSLNKAVSLNKVWEKMIKIIILIVFWRFITFPIINLIRGNDFTFTTTVIDAFSFRSGYTNHLWYLMALLLIFSLLPVLKEIFDKNIKLYLFLLFSMIFFVFGTDLFIQVFNLVSLTFEKLELQQIPFAHFINDFNFYSSARGFGIVYFMIGGMVYRYQNSFTGRSNLFYFMVEIGLIALQFLYNLLHSISTDSLYDGVWWAYENMLTIPLVICIYFFIKKFQIDNTFVKSCISLVSKNTLGIYLVHNIVFQLTPNLRSTMLSWNIHLGVVYSLIVLLLSLLITLLVKKTPFLNYFMKM